MTNTHPPPGPNLDWVWLAVVMAYTLASALAALLAWGRL